MTRAARRLTTYEPGSPAWLEQRQRAVGGSEIAAVVGLSPWHSRYSLWHRKAGYVPEDTSNWQTKEWGRRLEAVIADWYAEQHPDRRVRRCGTFQSIERPWQLASPDRQVYLGGGGSERGRVLLEIKNVRDSFEWGTPGSGEVPVYYRCQAMWQMDVAGEQRCDFAVLIAGQTFREYTLEYDPDEAEQLRAEGLAFVESIDRDEPPDIDSHSETYRVIRQMHPDIDGQDVEVSEAVGHLYMHALRRSDQVSHVLTRAKSQLLAEMGTARRAIFQGEAIALRYQFGDGVRLRPYKQPNQGEAA